MRNASRNAWYTLASLGLLAGGTGAAMFGAYRRDLAAARKASVGGSQIAQTARGPVEYAIAGEGPPALVIHGAGGGWDQGLLVAEMLGPGHRIVAPSRFGYLRTPVPADVSPAAQADAHAALLDSLHIERVLVVGVSAGGPSAAEFALRYPKRTSALILMVPRGYSPERAVGVDDLPANRLILRVIMRGADFAYWSMSRLSRSALLRFFGVPPKVAAGASPEGRAALTRIMRSMLPLSARLPGLRADSSIEVGPSPLEKITVPTLIITAKDDLFHTLPAAQYAADRIPRARLIVFESGGHLFVDRQGEVQREVSAFLSEIARKSARSLSVAH